MCGVPVPFIYLRFLIFAMTSYIIEQYQISSSRAYLFLLLNECYRGCSMCKCLAKFENWKANATHASYHSSVLFCLHINSESSISSSSVISVPAVLHCKQNNLGCSSGEGRFSTENSGTRLQFYQGLNRCGSFPLLSAEQ